MALILDTGPLYALLDRSDNRHEDCRSLVESSEEALVLPAPVVVEVNFLIRTRLHPAVMVSLLDDVISGFYRVESLIAEDHVRARELVERYADSDIGFVDAAVMAVVERMDEPKLMTLDRRHFGAIKPRHVEVLRLLPD